eukprot:TRINITY_DN1268_c0_g1_i4.p1 TRINITY_DN1268_c0_g1~~TRINITY_DN1268_c0_g1_i4.p1  ORF type:complete len:1108 (+),score=319.71 TRINITY_DN1268_c0_g1_i4:50-3325(+)
MAAPLMGVEALERRMEKVRSVAEEVLQSARHPHFAAHVPHGYGDKFAAAEAVVQGGAAAAANTLAALGLSVEAVGKMQGWQREGKRVTLRLEAAETCVFRKKTETKEVVGPTRETTVSVSGVSGFLRKLVSETKTVTRYHYEFAATWKLFAYAGSAPDGGEQVVLASRTGKTELTTTSSDPPNPELTFTPGGAVPVEVDVTWWLRHLVVGEGEQVGVEFRIARAAASTLTPRRNAEVDAAVAFFTGVVEFARAVHAYFVEWLWTVGPEVTAGADVAAVDAVGDVVVPVLPVLLGGSGESDSEDEGAAVAVPDGAVRCLAPAELDMLLAEETRTLESKLRDVASSFPGEGKAPSAPPSAAATPEDPSLVPNASMASRQSSCLGDEPTAGGVATRTEAVVVAALAHLRDVATAAIAGVNYVEAMLRQQLVGAVGAVLTAEHFAAYMAHHGRVLFNAAYIPQDFVHAVRVGTRDPEGTLAIRTAAGAVQTIVRQHAADAPLRFALSAAASVTASCEQYVHSMLRHEFNAGYASAGRGQKQGVAPAAPSEWYDGGDLAPEVVEGGAPVPCKAVPAPPEVYLEARSHVFCCGYVVVLGVMGGDDVLVPKHALVVQDGDEFKLPLAVETIPPPQEFQDIIAAMSPEQQRFCKAARAMQLEATLFAVLAVPIKPQLERAVGLPVGALDKDIALTRELLDLVQTCHIPTELLAYDSRTGAAATLPDRVAVVRTAAAAVRTVIDAAKEEVTQANMRARDVIEGRETAARKSISASETQAYKNLQRENQAQEKLSILSKTVALVNEMSVNISESLCRSDQLDNLQWQSDTLAAEAQCFRKTARRKKSMKSGSLLNRMRLPSMPSLGKSAVLFSGPCASSTPPSSAPPTAAETLMGNALGEPVVAEPDAGGQAPAAAGDAGDVGDNDLDAVEEGGGRGAKAAGTGGFGLSALPEVLEARYIEHDVGNAVRPTILKVADSAWTALQKPSLLAPAESHAVPPGEQNAGKRAAFALLDALTRSGALPVDAAQLHVVVAATHCFGTSLMDTLVQRNVDPVAQVERSLLIGASAVHQCPVATLIQDGAARRVAAHSPHLLPMAAVRP